MKYAPDAVLSSLGEVLFTSIWGIVEPHTGFEAFAALDPKDVRIIDRESKRSGIDRAQLVRSWVKEKIGHIENQTDL